jgi:hypothetical protein
MNRGGSKAARTTAGAASTRRGRGSFGFKAGVLQDCRPGSRVRFPEPHRWDLETFVPEVAFEDGDFHLSRR